MTPAAPPDAPPAVARATAPAGTVTIGVTANPASTRLELDGRAVSSPLELPRSTERHVLRASARGYRDQAIEIVADRDRSLDVRLQRQVRRRVKPRADDGLMGGAEL